MPIKIHVHTEIYLLTESTIDAHNAFLESIAPAHDIRILILEPRMKRLSMIYLILVLLLASLLGSFL